MIQTTPFSQRDSRWANVPLGFGTGTIGQYGCTMTSLTMLLNSKGANLTPLQVNQIMKDKGGFSGNLVWWSKLPQCFPQLTKVGVPVAYDNTQVKNLIDKGYPVIVNVDGSPIGAPDHWVLFVGDQTMLDPWDGKGKPTSSYKVKKYVAIEVTAVADPLKQLQIENETLKKRIAELDGVVGQLKNTETFLRGEIGKKDTEIATYKAKLNSIKSMATI